MAETNKQPSKLHQITKRLDILGKRFDLRFETRSGSFQTTTGGYVTLMTGMISLGTFIVILAQYLKKVTPVVTTSTTFSPTNVMINLYEEDIWTPNGFGSGPIIHRSWTHSKYVTLVYEIKKRSYNEKTKKLETKVLKKIPFVACRDIQDEKAKKYLKDTNSLPGFIDVINCPNLDDPEVRQQLVISKDNQDFSEIDYSIKIYPCSLEDPSKCANQFQMIALRSDFMKISRVIEASDYANPVRSILDRNSHMIDMSVGKKVYLEASKNKIYDDTSQFTQPKLKQEFSTMRVKKTDFEMRDRTQIYCTKTQIDQGACKEFVSFEYQVSDEINIIVRNYQKFSTLMGEFGGILKIITSTIFLAYSIYNLRVMRSYMRGAVLGLDKNSVNKLKTMAQRDQRKPKEKDINTVIEELVNQRCSAADFMKKLNLLEVMEESLFQPFEKKLIPLVIMRGNQRQSQGSENNQKDQEKSCCQKQQNPSSSNEKISNTASRDQDRDELTFKDLSRKLGKIGAFESDYLDAYKRLHEESEFGLYLKEKEDMRHYMLSQLSDVFPTD